MSSVKCHISISLDGFVAGPNQSVENPIGEGGMRLHGWAFATDSRRELHGEEGGRRSPDAEVAAGAESALEGSGERLLAAVGDPRLEPVKVVASPAVTHLKYRVVRP